MLTFPAEGLATQRMVLHAATPDHAQALQSYHLANRAHLKPWEPSRVDGFYTLDAVASRLVSMQQKVTSGHALFLVLHRSDNNALIGECNLTNIVRGPFQACHLGFSIARECEGQGWMREALACLIEYAFGPLGLHRVMANYRPENERSGRLLASLGFQREGLAHAYLKIDGAWADHVLTSLINPVGD